MDRLAFFRYEKSYSGIWQPVVYFDEIPTKLTGYSECTEAVALSPEDFEVTGDPIAFSILSRKYPNPRGSENV